MQKQLDFNGQKPAETKKKAEVMPQGVLFRGGEEKACRQRFIKDGILEAVIGLPAGLFYGTGIPACVLVLNRDGASGRKSALFLSADREYREGKNQNSLRAEDIEKITHVYHTRLAVDKYSREVPYAELEREDSNLNIRRYVDNSPPPEPHDVRTHLHGGIPVSEIDQLAGYFDNYAGVRELLFQCSHHVPRDDIQDARRGEAKREHRVPRKACHHAEHDDASEDDVGEEADTERCVLPKSLVKALKDERKTLSGEIKEMKKRVKDMRLDTGRMAGIKAPRREINELRADASDIEGEALAKSQRVDAIVITAERDDYIGVMTTNIGASMSDVRERIQVFDPKQDVLVVHRRLPHWAQAGTICYITFRTDDSLPKPVMERWLQERNAFLRLHQIDPFAPDWRQRLKELDPKVKDAFDRTLSNKWHDNLDACHGACVLRRQELGKIVADSLHKFDGDR